MSAAPQVFSDWAQQRLTSIEAALDHFLPSADQVPLRLHNAMRYTTLGGGKRVRPLLVYAAGDLFAGSRQLLDQAAVAVEMIHVYSLVHDDMPCMDDDALRRGKPTVHIHYDEATALLTGDALQAQAFEVLSRPVGNTAEAARQLQMLHVLSRAAGSSGMCGGQAIDLSSIGVKLSLRELEQMHILKTGALLRASIFLGALSGKSLSEVEAAALDTYAQAIGLAFQVVDDILDVTSDSATLGKTAGKDAADNKPTYVSILGLSESQMLAEKLHSDAHRALESFGERGLRLRQLADLIVHRTS